MTADPRPAVFLDTNVLVYAVDGADPVKRARARALLAGGEGTPVLSVQVLREFYVVVTRKLTPPVRPEVAEGWVRTLAGGHVLEENDALLLAAIRLHQAHAISLWDALIIEAAVAAGCATVLSEDLHDGWSARGVTVRNPFAHTA